MGDKSISAIVLAGGDSKRMGQNKALLKLGPDTMIEKIVKILQPLFKETIIVTNNPEEYHMLEGITFVRDFQRLKGKSSLIGLYSGLLAANNPYIFAVACDMPLLNTSLIKYMKKQINEQDILIPKINDFYEPLHAFYNKSCLSPMKKQLDKKDYKILNFFSNIGNIQTINEDAIRVFDPLLNSFLNINNYNEYLEFKRRNLVKI